MTFPTELLEARQQAGLTQQQLADIIGVQRQTVGNWEAGRTPLAPFFQGCLLSYLRATRS